MAGPFGTSTDSRVVTGSSLARANRRGKPCSPGTGLGAGHTRGARLLVRGPGVPDPYAVLVSEVMLQQTQAARVAPAFEAFMTRFPDVRTLASSSCADVLRAWGRLGYPRRAVALHRAAGEIVERHAAVVPRDPVALRALAGVGEYTAAAVASLAYGVAGRGRRHQRSQGLGAGRPRRGAGRGARTRAVRGRSRMARLLVDLPRGTQALMDLGREVCRPTPRCDVCPLRPWCAFAAEGRAGRSSTRRQPKFEGSLRQVRGSALAALQERSPRTLGGLARAIGLPPERVAKAIDGLERDGVVAASGGALAGRDRGRVRLADGP